jgi:hypothetical protein
VKIPCPQCGGDVQLQEATGFPPCPFCGASLVLDLTGVRPHMLYRPRHGPAEVLPLLRRWCDAEGFPSPSAASMPHTVYQPFWRFVSQGRPRLVPAWPTLEDRWADLPLPEAEQVIYDPSIVGTARAVEPTVAEAAARSRVFGASAASVPAGDLVHIPFYEIQATVGRGRLAASIEACSGRVYPGRMPAGNRTAARQTGAATIAVVGFALLFLESMFIPPLWLAALVVAISAWVIYRMVITTMGSAT